MILINNEVENNIDKDINNDETECLICFDKTTDLNNVNDMITLECNHSFCYDCLLESYKGVKCNFSNTIHRICPYCRKKAKLLLLKDMMKTEGGKRIAEGRHEFMKSFLQQFSHEINGKA